MAPPPVVTGISPKEGPPGTRVTVRGEFLGNKSQDRSKNKKKETVESFKF